MRGGNCLNEKTSSLTIEEKEKFMMEAIIEAKKAESMKEVPIGAIVVLDGKIIGRGHNLREESQDATAHAEMFAIKQACDAVDNWRLERAQMFVTLEPCPMCSGAMILSRVDEVYYGAKDPKGGTAGTLMNLLEDERFNHIAYVESGILEEECGKLLSNFFRKLREKKKLLKNQQKD
ncbi:tRNA adenosine(34) deaminase TadA [Enterococcus sp. DIV0212c]|uniref:tRNA adenosine(34) deaminase TadA n=1 Tax=Enterococcus sp. DIV0212c TaxID=2230867 RepID=UPI0035C7CAF0